MNNRLDPRTLASSATEARALQQLHHHRNRGASDRFYTATSLSIVHAPHAGFFAWHTRRPWKTTRCDSIVQSRWSIQRAHRNVDL